MLLAEDSTGTELAREAIDLCERAVKSSANQKRKALLGQGLEVAERAVSTAERDAKAHFAVFCNLGRTLEAEGASLASIAQIRRLRDTIDRSLALAPNFVDALAAKGAFLVRLPSFLGGNKDEGERLIRRAVELAPDHPPARLQLAKALSEKGEDQAALKEVRTVVALAGRRGSVAEFSEA